MPITNSKREIVWRKKSIEGKKNPHTIDIFQIYRLVISEKDYNEAIPYSKYEAVIKMYFQEAIKMMILTGREFFLSKKLGAMSLTKRKLVGAFYDSMTLEEKIEKGFIKRDRATGQLILNRHSSGAYYAIKWKKPVNYNLRFVKLKTNHNVRGLITFSSWSNIIHSQNEKTNEI